MSRKAACILDLPGGKLRVMTAENALPGSGVFHKKKAAVYAAFSLLLITLYKVDISITDD